MPCDRATGFQPVVCKCPCKTKTYITFCRSQEASVFRNSEGYHTLPGRYKKFFFRRHSRGTDLDQLFLPHGSTKCGPVLNYAVRDQLGNAVQVGEVIDFTESHDAACFLQGRCSIK